jgi:hypothetical protein
MPSIELELLKDVYISLGNELVLFKSKMFPGSFNQQPGDNRW